MSRSASVVFGLSTGARPTFSFLTTTRLNPLRAPLARESEQPLCGPATAGRIERAHGGFVVARGGIPTALAHETEQGPHWKPTGTLSDCALGEDLGDAFGLEREGAGHLSGEQIQLCYQNHWFAQRLRLPQSQ